MVCIDSGKEKRLNLLVNLLKIFWNLEDINLYFYLMKCGYKKVIVKLIYVIFNFFIVIMFGFGFFFW